MPNLQLADRIPRPNYILVDSLKVYEQMLRSSGLTSRASFDYETSAVMNENYLRAKGNAKPKVDLIRSEITSVSFRFSDGKCYYLPVNHRDSFNLPKQAIIDVLDAKPHAAPLSAHNMAFEWLISKKCLGVDLRQYGELRDTMIAAKVADSNQAVGLKELTMNKLGIVQGTYEDLTNGRMMCELTAQEAFRYGCDDSEFQYQLDELFEKVITDNGLMQYYTELEMPIIPIISEMTLDGAYVNPDKLAQKTKEHLFQMDRLEKEIHTALGKKVNLNSPVAMGRILYEELNIPFPPYAESKTATDKESLYWNINEHPIMPLFIDYKKFATRYKLYDKPYACLIHPDTGMVHSQLKPLADTGRFTSSGPNLQQLAKRGDGIEVREMFTPPEPYDLVLACDMSQVELVLAAHRSQSPELLKAYGPVRGDIHTATCMFMFEISAEVAKANKVYRTAGKTANFSLLYGGTAKRIFRLIKLELAKMGLPMSFSLRDVEQMIIRYFQLYPEIRAMQKNDVALAKKYGYVKSLFGRRFYLPEINSRRSFIRSKQERKATNSPIQGTCAELIKRAIINIYNERIPKSDARKWTSIHDENVFYVTKKALPDVARIVHKHTSATPAGLKAHMASEVTVGPNFGDQTVYEVED